MENNSGKTTSGRPQRRQAPRRANNAVRANNNVPVNRASKKSNVNNKHNNVAANKNQQWVKKDDNAAETKPQKNAFFAWWARVKEMFAGIITGGIDDFRENGWKVFRTLPLALGLLFIVTGTLLITSPDINIKILSFLGFCVGTFVLSMTKNTWFRNIFDGIRGKRKSKKGDSSKSTSKLRKKERMR